MRDLSETLVAIGSRLKADGFWPEVEDAIRLHRPAGMRPTKRSNIATLAELRLVMLRAGYPIQAVKTFDR